MEEQSWGARFACVEIKFSAPKGLKNDGYTKPIQIDVYSSVENTKVGESYLKYRFDENGFYDKDLRRYYDLIVVSTILLKEKYRRLGIGGEIIRQLAMKFPDSLFILENMKTEDSRRWSKDRLERVYPSRMLNVDNGVEARVTPGEEVDPRELNSMRRAMRRCFDRCRLHIFAVRGLKKHG